MEQTYHMTIEEIVMHPAVSRAMSGIDRTPALDILVRLRRARRNVKRAAANMREEAAVYGTLRGAWGRGQICVIPAMPGNRLLCAALESDGLPSELRAGISEYLEYAEEG